MTFMPTGRPISWYRLVIIYIIMHVSASDIDLSRHVAGIRIPIKLVLFIYLFIYDMNTFYVPGIPFVGDYNWRSCI